MTHRIIAFSLLLFSAIVAGAQTAPPPIDIAHAPAPLFDDPIWHGASDPFVIWNPKTSEWLMYYTQRRATLDPANGVDWVHGSAIGIAASKDGINWIYKGICQGDFNLGDPMNAKVTWWAPTLVYENNKFHMYVVLVDGIYTTWIGNRTIEHFTSDDGMIWTHISTAALSSMRCIDPFVMKIGDTWCMWYKDEAKGSQTWLAQSPDMDKWTVTGEMVGSPGQEAPYVWQWHDAYWLMTDRTGRPGGLRIYRSDSGLKDWKLNTTILDQPDGRRPLDNAIGHHPAILMQKDASQNDQCLLFYFTQHGRTSVLQMAELTLGADGKVVCERNKYAPATQSSK
jgi:hypothetical protein